MQIVFTFDRLNLMHLVLGLFAFWMGLRDLLGKDPLIHTFFNQYDRDPEYRAMWQKKNGVLPLSFYLFSISCFRLWSNRPQKNDPENSFQGHKSTVYPAHSATIRLLIQLSTASCTGPASL